MEPTHLIYTFAVTACVLVHCTKTLPPYRAVFQVKRVLKKWGTGGLRQAAPSPKGCEVVDNRMDTRKVQMDNDLDTML